MTQRVSSNTTLFFKMFFPIGWGVFFAAFTAALYIVDKETLPFLTAPIFKYTFTIFFLAFLGLFYISVGKLKRVEMAEDHYIVSNYFKSYKLIYEDIESIKIMPLGRLSWVTFNLKAAGSFGKKITFLRSNNLFRLFANQYPSVGAMLDGKA
jgi:hypothetical protein